MKGNTSRRVVAAVMASVLLFSGAAAASSINATSGVEYQTNSGLTVTAGEAHSVGTSPFNGSETVVVNNVSFSASSTAAVTADDFIGTYTNLSSINAGGTHITVNPGDKQQINVSDGLDSLDFRNVGVDNAAVDFSYSASSTAFVSVETGLTNTQLAAVDTSTDAIIDTTTTDATGQATFDALDSGSHEIAIKTTAAPELSVVNPTNGATLDDSDANLTVDVSDADFGDTKDSVDVEFINADDNSVIETKTVTQNTTVSTQWTAAILGKNEWYATATDSFSRNTSTANQTFETPNVLKIYNETKPSSLIDDGPTIRVRAYAEDEVLLERTTDNGTLSLDGFPSDKRLILTVVGEETDKYTYRRIIVNDITETQSVYLLNTNQPNSRILFQLDDPAGRFPPEATRLYVERPITKDYDSDGTNETRYQTIAGDTFGSVGEFPAVLQTDARYRLRVETDVADQSRILGAYSVSGPQRVPLQIQRISPEGNVDPGRSVSGGIEGDQVVIRYFDPSKSSKNVEYTVVNESGATVVPNNTRTVNQFADFYDLPGGANATYTVKWTVTTDDGNVTSGSFEAGRIVEGVSKRINADPAWLELLSYVAILASMGLVVLVSAQLAPLTGTAVASILTVIGTVAIPAPILGIAGAISVLLPLGRR